MGQDIFSLSLLVQVFFLFRMALQEIFFKITHPSSQKLNGRPLMKDPGIGWSRDSSKI
jgi:hypothetical protein